MLLLRSSTGALFLSTLSLRRATIATKYSWSGFSISIHALLAESDQLQKIGKCACPISIHALLAESDLPTGGQTFDINLFLSTLSLRRATFNGVHGHISGDISIHALLAESDYTDSQSCCVAAISIHALLAESDLVLFDGGIVPCQVISIHALLAESDAPPAIYPVWGA